MSKWVERIKILNKYYTKLEEQEILVKTEEKFIVCVCGWVEFEYVLSQTVNCESELGNSLCVCMCIWVTEILRAA